ncbi:MAG: DUF1059 domain-containing protein [Alphaproteobacteria bacterium]|nr:DUF1059 domain-containing protein [Alphaproteobacteria bacterium]
MKEKRKVIDCRLFTNDNKCTDNKCTLALSGTEEEVLKAATEHAITSHGAKDTPELKQEIRKMIKDE